jgi:hypothetical protein
MAWTTRAAVSGIGAVTLGGLFLGAGRGWPDYSPPLPERGYALPDDPEALALLREAAALMQADDTDYQQILDSEGMPWDLSSWRQASEALELMERVMARPGLRTPLPASYADDFGLEVSALLDLARARMARGWASAAGGDAEAARADMLGALAFGARIEQSADALLPQMVGIGIQNKALGELAELDALLPPDAAHDIAPVESRLPQAMIEECRWVEGALNEIVEHPDGILQVLVPNAADPLERLVIAVGYDAEATTASLRLSCLHEAGMASLPYSARQWPARERMFEDGGPVGQYIDNPVGRMLLDTLWLDNERFADRRTALEARYVGVRTASALRAYQDDTGRLPRRLTELVPGYLEELPIEPFSNQPVAWDAASGTLEIALPAELEGSDIDQYLSWRF